MTTPNAALAYYREHQDLIRQLLDQMVAGIREKGDLPAEEVFAGVASTFSDDPTRGAVFAAAAVMRLAWPNGSLGPAQPPIEVPTVELIPDPDGGAS